MCKLTETFMGLDQTPNQVHCIPIDCWSAQIAPQTYAEPLENRLPNIRVWYATRRTHSCRREVKIPILTGNALMAITNLVYPLVVVT